MELSYHIWTCVAVDGRRHYQSNHLVTLIACRPRLAWERDDRLSVQRWADGINTWPNAAQKLNRPLGLFQQKSGLPHGRQSFSFSEGLVDFNWHFSGEYGILSVTISDVGGGRLLSKLKSAVVGVFSGMYCRPNALIEKTVYALNDYHIVSVLKMTWNL